MTKIEPAKNCWCGNPIKPRSDGGKPKTHCSAVCRRVFPAALMAWARERFDAEEIGAEELRQALERKRSAQRQSKDFATKDAHPHG